MDSDSIHIKRFGKKDDVSGTKLRCYPGDVIFGRRRAYQRKAAIVEFDGFCSAHSLVLRANPEVIDPRLFPFFLHSDTFMHRAIDISVGSLSPTINWGTLKNEEFLLPPKDQQASLTELLWATDEVVENYYNLERRLQSAYSIAIDKVYNGPSNLDLKELSSIAKINSDTIKSSTPAAFKFKYLDIASIIEPKILGELQWYIFGEAPSRARRIVKNGDIVISLVRPYQNSVVIIDNASDVIASTGTGVISVNDGVSNKFILHQFFSNRFSEFCKERMTGTNYPAITPRDLAEFKVFYSDDFKVQDSIASKLDALDASSRLIKFSLSRSKQLQKSLINQVF